MYLPLVQGCESEKVIRLLLNNLPKMNENTKEALVCHFSKGGSFKHIDMMHGINAGNLNRAIGKINAVNENQEETEKEKRIHLSDNKNQSQTGRED